MLIIMSTELMQVCERRRKRSLLFQWKHQLQHLSS
ncbi:hypothetical protein SLEP1_g14713 [Rubroshorea leprosula]|uniref:Uncharacterized protein n=1 Tax=Rubroshorea leprosula TaxID=152421 RepID=A0AAV5IJY8_9ROSI|nr:hypothetical protein SLEP1_g14713 [Rubroshorea leprosula]